MVVVEKIFEIFRQKSDFYPFLRVSIVLKPSKMILREKLGQETLFSGFLNTGAQREKEQFLVALIIFLLLYRFKGPLFVT